MTKSTRVFFKQSFCNPQVEYLYQLQYFDGVGKMLSINRKTTEIITTADDCQVEVESWESMFHKIESPDFPITMPYIDLILSEWGTSLAEFLRETGPAGDYCL